MAVTAYKFAGTGANDASFGSQAWSNPGNIVSDNGSDATAAEGDHTTNYLKGTNFGFTSTDIPVGSTIDGIELEYERFQEEGIAVIENNRLRAVKGGSVIGSNVSGMNMILWSVGTPEVITEGGATNLWGTTWTQADVTASDFGFVLAADMAAGPGIRAAHVDFFRCRIYYTAPAGGTNIPAIMHQYRRRRV